jgi:putative two-component system hydrogenase maturation factor HypX/HoxX
MQHRLPMLAAEAVRCGFYDAVLPAPTFRVDVLRRAAELVAGFYDVVAARRARRARDEAERPLAAYRAEELAHMHRNFYGFDPSYHVARWHFVSKSPQSWTPRHLARHRQVI